MSWYDETRVSRPGSVVLQAWLAERQAQRVNNAVSSAELRVSSSEIRKGDAIWASLTGDSHPAGVFVSPETARRVAAVYACVRIICGTIATLPMHVFRRVVNDRERAHNHPLWWLLNEQPHPRWTSQAMWEYALTAKLLRGDGIIQILRRPDGVPFGLRPLLVGDVDWECHQDRLRYFAHLPGEAPIGLDQDDVLHLAGFGFNGVRGESVIRHAARNAVGTALAADEFSASFFGNSARPDVVIQAEGKVSPDAVELLRDTWDERHRGVGRSHRPALLTGGMTIKQLSLSAEDAQLLDTRKFQVIEIARAFGVPPHMIGETEKTSSWGAGVEHMSIGFVRYTLRQHLKQIEQEINRKLFRTPEYFVEFNVDSLLQGDSKAEADYFKAALGGPGAQGWMTINEVRRLKNQPPLPEGNQLVISGRDHAKPEPAI